MMHALRLTAVLSALVLAPAPAEGHLVPRPLRLERVNRKLCGRVIDHSRNHGPDHRVFSPALGEKRDLYVYVPPGYDPAKKYPLILYLHGITQDESGFLDEVIIPLDKAIAEGRLPPCIVAAPDGSVHGLNCLTTAGTFFLNSRLGPFEDYLIKDVYEFLLRSYSIRPEPEAHVILGASMGGGAAFNLTIKYPDRFRIAIGLFPPLNSRWESCRGRYMDNFAENCWGWREDFSRGMEVMGRFYGVITIRTRRLIYPLFGRDNATILPQVIAENPIEMLDSYNVLPDQFHMYVGYGGKDQFNIDAQVESFLARACQKKIPVGVGYDPNGKHDLATALRLLPGLLEWLKPRLSPFAP